MGVKYGERALFMHNWCESIKDSIKVKAYDLPTRRSGLN